MNTFSNLLSTQIFKISFVCLNKVISDKSIPLNTTETLLVGGLIFLAYKVERKIGNANSLIFQPTSVTDIHLENSTAVMTLGILVQNPTGSKFTVYSMAGSISANNYIVGNVSNFTGFVIPENSQSIFYLQIRLGVHPLVNEIISAFTNQHFGQDLELDGTVNVDNIPIRVKLNYHVGL